MNRKSNNKRSGLLSIAIGLLAYGWIIPCPSQTLEAIKASPGYVDSVYVYYTISLGEGFDPSVDYGNLYLKVHMLFHRGDGLPADQGLDIDDRPAFRPAYGVVTTDGSNPTNRFPSHLPVPAPGPWDYQSVITFIGDGRLYDPNTNVVGYVSAVNAEVVITPVSLPATFTTNYLNIEVTVNYGPPKTDCKKCPSGSCPPGEVTANMNSVDVQIALDKDTYGDFNNAVFLRSALPTAFLTKPHSLASFVSTNCEVITNINGLKQVLTPQILADVVVSNDYRYDVRFYYRTDLAASKDTNGFWVPTNAAYKIVAFENPDTSSSSNRLFVSEILGGTTNQTKYTWDGTNKWTLELPGGIRKETLSRFWNSNNTERAEVKSILSTNDVLAYQEQKKYKVFPWGEQLVEHVIDTNSARLTNTWDYYTNGSKGTYSQLKQKAEPGGYWERYEYDDSYRLTNKVVAYLNATNGAAADQSRQFIAIYSTNHLTVTNIQKVLGQEISRTYVVYSTDEAKEIRSQIPGASMDDTNNLINITTKYPTNSLFKRELKSIRNADGTMAFYSYVITNGQKTTTLSVGQTNSAGTNVLEGTKTTTVVGSMGEMISRTVADITNSVDGIMISRETYTYPSGDTLKLSPRTAYLDGTSSEVNYGCCHIDNTVDRDGTVTSYTYDALHRQTAATRNNITISNVLDAAGNVLKTTRFGSDGSQITQSKTGYDAAGRVVQQTNALDGATSTTYFYDSQGQLIKTNSFPDGGQRIETYYLDGQLQKVSGSATFPVRYEYGLGQDGGNYVLYTKEVKLDSGGSDTSEWTTNYVDAAGRSYKTVFAAASTPYPAHQAYFNSLGQLWKEIDPDGVRTLYAYNGKGELSFTTIDSNRNDVIDFAGLDRITQTTNDVIANYSTNVVRTRTYVWSINGSSTATLLSAREVSVEGLKTWENFAGVTNTTVTSLPSGGARTITQTGPDGSYSISLYQNGRLSSVTRYSSNAVQVAGMTYGYDPHGRQSTITDARNGTTTYTYNNADQVASLTTPAPGNGQSGQTTFTYYNAMLQATSTTLSDGGSVTNFYSPRGEVLRTTGARTYPVAYSYDAQGRLKTMTNWSSYATGTGARVTTWNYDSYRGFLSGKLYADTNGPTYTYTPAGRLQIRTWARPVGTTNVYNDAGDLRVVDYSDTTTDVSYTYDRRSRPVTITQGANTTALIYNDAGQLLSEASTAGLLNGFAVTNSYDSVLRRTSLILRSNTAALFTHSYGYDSTSRLTNVSDGTYSAAYSYLANSPLISQTSFRHSGTLRMTTTKQYDYLNRLQSISSIASNTISSAYEYSDASQRTRRIEGDGSLWVYGYDGLGQVTSGKKYWQDWTPVAGQQFEYAFDDIGNRNSTKVGGDSLGAALRVANYTNNNLNQITRRDVPGTLDILGLAKATATATVNGQSTYRRGEYYQAALAFDNSSAALYPSITNRAVLSSETNTLIGNLFIPKTQETFGYDADGNLTNDGRWTLTWDAENRLVSMESFASAPDASKRKLEFVYDQRGRRLQKKVSTWNGAAYVAQSTNRFVYDAWNLVADLNPASALVCSYVWGSDLSGSLQGAGGVGGLLAVNSATGGVHFVAYDGNGNVAVLINATNGATSANYEYGPFGELIRKTGAASSINRVRFSTKFQDEETDLLYYTFRYYNPSAGRWLNRDPISEDGGANLYGFVYNNTANWLDTDGRAMLPPGMPYYTPYVPPVPRPRPPPPSGTCRIELCCQPVGPFGSAHCVIRFTYSDGRNSGCRAGPTGKGNSSGAGGSSGSSGSGAGNRQSAHCKGCCGRWGNIVAGCGKGANNRNDPLEFGLWDDLNEARQNPGQCTLIEESALACSVEACVAREMQKITSRCYIYDASGPNSNTAWYQALKQCGHTVDPPGLQPGRTDDLSKAKTCVK